jgi:hypothetical protein
MQTTLQSPNRRTAALPPPIPGGGASSSSLDHRNLSDENPHQDTPEQEYRFRYHPRTRTMLLAAASELDLSESALARLRNCGSDAWVQREITTGRVRIAANTCKLRFCPACQAHLAHVTKDRLTAVIAAAPIAEWRFVTLTLRHSRSSLRDQLTHLRASFRRLRQRRAWKGRVAAGIGVIEVKWNPKTAQWHPHLHLAVRGEFFPQKLLSTEWLTASRNSHIVDIRTIWRVEDAVTYLTKYLSKSTIPAFGDSLDPLIEFINATKNGRMLIAFGLPADALAKPPREPTPGSWEPIGNLATFIARAAAGSDYHRRILAQLDHAEPDLSLTPTKQRHPSLFPPTGNHDP